MVRGYTQKAIKENVDIIMGEGIDEDTALAISISYARGLYKQDKPQTTIFPKHLLPQLSIKMYRDYKGGDVDVDIQEEG